MQAKLIQRVVGPWPMNTYVVICEDTRTSAIVDPGADADTILRLIDGTKVDMINTELAQTSRRSTLPAG